MGGFWTRLLNITEHWPSCLGVAVAHERHLYGNLRAEVVSNLGVRIQRVSLSKPRLICITPSDRRRRGNL